jgi:GTP cyclohydrolase I
MNPKINKPKIEKAVRMILEAIGDDPKREGLRLTPARVARMYEEIFGQGTPDPAAALRVTFDEEHHEIVLVKDIPFYSMCEHHLLPFFGRAHVAYIPNGKIVGISKIARVVEAFARRPQVQERMTSQIADLINDKLGAEGVAVIIEAIHTCMTMRGVKKPGATVVTSAMRGDFRENITTRTEIMSLIYGRPFQAG